MELFDVIRIRRSVRRYSDKPVEDEKVIRCLEAARLAPSWKNLQCWYFIVVRDKDKINAMTTPTNPWLPQAPCVIVACADPTKSGEREGKQYYLVDTAIAMEHLILAATDMGLGTCWIGKFDEGKIKEMLEVPENIRIVALTPLGYPAEGFDISTAIASQGYGRRKPLEEILFWEKWGAHKQ